MISIARRYSSFKRVITALKSNEANYGTGKVKELRAALKAGQIATRNYLKFNCMEDIITENRPKDEKIKKEDLLKLFTGTVEKGEAFIEQPDNKKHSILFDAIELMDTYLKVEEGEG